MSMITTDDAVASSSKIAPGPTGPSTVRGLEEEERMLAQKITNLEKRWCEIDELKASGCVVDTIALGKLTDELIRLKVQHAQNQENIEQARMAEKGSAAAPGGSHSRGLVRNSGSFFNSMRRNMSNTTPSDGSPERQGENGVSVETKTLEAQRINAKAKQGRGKLVVDDITEKYLNDRVYLEDDSDFTSTDDVSSDDEDDSIASQLPGGVIPVIHTSQARMSANRTKELSYRGVYGVDARSTRAYSSRMSRTLSARTMSMRSHQPGSFAKMREQGHGASAPGGLRADSVLSGKDDEEEGELPAVQIYEDDGTSDMKHKIFLMTKLDSVIIREPAMSTLEYGSSSWGYDLVAFLQNPVRREVYDLYYLYSSMAKRMYFLESDEFELFFKWFELFRYAVFEFLNVEEEIVYPALDNADAGGNPGFDGAHSPAGRKAMKKNIRSAIDRIWEYREMVPMQAPGSSIKTLGTMLDDVSRAILTYFNEQMRVLPKAVQRRLMPNDVRAVEEKVIVALRRKRYPHDLFQIVMHWSRRDSREFRTRMRKTYLDRGNSISKSIWLKQYQAGRSQFRKEHLKVIQTSFERWNAFEGEKIKAMEEEEVSQFQNPFMRGTV